MAKQRRSKTAASLQSSILSRLKKTHRTAGGASSTPQTHPTQAQSRTAIGTGCIRDHSPKSPPELDNDDLPSPDLHATTHKRKRPDEPDPKIHTTDETPRSNSKVKRTDREESKNNQHDPNHENTARSQNSKEKKSTIDGGSKLISEFHRIEKLLSPPNLDPLTRHKLKLEQRKLGGLKAYQTASKIGGSVQNGGETGKWCAKTLIRLGLRPSSQLATTQKIKLLDVGAIDGKSYLKFKDWIATTSIDINPTDGSDVLKYDFFEFPLPQTEDERFDVVCLSLVLNFVGDLKKRGEMIKRARKFLKIGGNLFIALPLACLNNSRYLDSSRFEKILKYLGFKLLVHHDSPKLTYWFLENLTQEQQQKDQELDHADEDGEDEGAIKTDVKSNRHQKALKFPKVQIRSGINRNNFCIKV